MLQQTTALRSLLNDPTLLETRAYIGGAFIDGDSQFDVINPARGDVIAQVADLSRAQVAGAIAQAEAAQKDWAKWTGKERAAVLRRWFDLMMENQEDLAVILTAEMGNPWQRRAAKSPMALLSSNFLRKRQNASTARPSPAISVTNASRC